MDLKTKSRASQIPEKQSHLISARSKYNNVHVFCVGCYRIRPAEKKLLLWDMMEVANLP